MFRKLQIRLTIICACSTGLVLIGMAVASYLFAAQQMVRQWEESFQSDINSLFFYLRGRGAIDHAYLAQLEATGGLYIRIESKGRPLFFTSLDPEREASTAQAAQTALRYYNFDYRQPPVGTLQADKVFFDFYTGEGGATWKYGPNRNYYRAVAASVPVDTSRWMSVIVLKNQRSEQLQLSELRLVYTGYVLIALSCLGVFAWVFSGWATAPVEEGYKRQANFVSAASHELRSPLAVIRASADAMRDAPPDAVGRFADKIDSECSRLGGLTEDLLRLASADTKRMTSSKKAADPVTLVLTAVERYEHLAGEKAIRITTRLPEEDLPPFPCDPVRIDQLLGILIDNAVCYTPEGGKICLSIEPSHRMISFVVSDSGPGIPADERKKVFERFYRVDQSRTQKDHYGLGLSIAQEIVDLHRGAIFIRDASLGGAEFVVMIPY